MTTMFIFQANEFLTIITTQQSLGPLGTGGFWVGRESWVNAVKLKQVSEKKVKYV